MKSTYFLLLCLTLLWACQGALVEDDNEFDAAYQAAWEAYSNDAKHAQPVVEEAYELAHNGGRVEWRAKSSFLLGLTFERAKEYSPAYRYFWEAKDLYKQLGNEEYLQHSNYSLGYISLVAKDYDGAELLLTEATAFFQLYGPETQLANCYWALGRVYLDKGNLSRAKEYLEKAKNVPFGNSVLLGNVNKALGLIARETRHYQESVECLNRAIYYAQDANSIINLATAKMSLSMTSFQAQKHQAAAVEAEEAIRLLGNHEAYSGHKSLFHYHHAKALIALGQVDAARYTLEQIPEKEERLVFRQDWHMAMQKLVSVCLLQGDNEAASQYTQVLEAAAARLKDQEGGLGQMALYKEIQAYRMQAMEKAAGEGGHGPQQGYWVWVLGCMLLLLALVVALFFVQAYRYSARNHLYNHRAVQERDWLHVKVLELMRDRTGLSQEEISDFYIQAAQETPMDRELKMQALSHTPLFHLVQFFAQLFRPRRNTGNADLE